MPLKDVKVGTALRMPPKRAIKYFESKGNKITWDWREQLKMNNHLAFTVAKVGKMDILQEMRGEIKKALDNGIPFKQFKKELQPRLARMGWAPREKRAPDGKLIQLGAPARLSIIYETNMQSSYNAGRYQAFMDNKKNRPYLLYVAVVDDSTRPAHLDLNGQLHPVDSKFWDSYTPPNGYRCRCRIRALSEKQAERKGGITKVAPKYKKGPKKGNVVRPDKGFSGNPGTKNWNPNPAKYDKDIWNLGKTLPPPPMPKKKPPFKAEKPKTIGKTKGFQKQNTIADCEKWGVANGVAKEIDYTGVDLKYANDINEQLYYLRNKYPGTFLEKIGVNETSAYASVGNKRIMNLNPAWFGNVQKFQNKRAGEMAALAKVRIDPNRSAAKNVVTHEFGHTLVYGLEVKGSYKYGIKINPKYAEIKKIRRDYRAELKRVRKKFPAGPGPFAPSKQFKEIYISDYANYKYIQSGDDYSEFIAESFSQYERGEIKNKFTDRMGKFFEQQFGVKNGK